MAQNSTGTPNSVHPQSGCPASGSTFGAAKLLGGGQISAEGSCMTQAPSHYPFNTNFPTQTIKQSSSS